MYENTYHITFSVPLSNTSMQGNCALNKLPLLFMDVNHFLSWHFLGIRIINDTIIYLKVCQQPPAIVLSLQ